MDVTRARKLPPAVACLLALGVALSIVQQLAIRDEVFVSGDGGIKTLIAKQFARGDWHADLRLPAAPWVQELWQSGFYPFGPPFAYQREGRWFIQYPTPFMALTAPFYGVLGFRGLTLVPLLGLWLLWLSTAALMRRFGASQAASATTIAGLIFCSFVTPYGAMYWEHTLALGLSFAGLALLLARDAASGRVALDLIGGVLLGVAVWFRPESAAFAAGTCLGLVVLRDLRAGLAAGAGFALPCLVLAGLNLLLYGSPLGVHAIQQVDPLTDYVAHFPAHEIAWYFVDQLFRYCPVFAVLIGAELAGTRIPALRMDRRRSILWGIVAVSYAGTVAMVPNDGGTQLGARYFLHILPLLFLLLGLVWDRSAQLSQRGRNALRAAITLGLAAGVYLNAVSTTQALFLDYRYRTLPTLHALRADPNPVVVVEHQWMAQDLEALFDEKVFFRVRTEAELAQLSHALLERGMPRFTLIRYRDFPVNDIETDGLRLELQPIAQGGHYVIIHCTVERG